MLQEVGSIALALGLAVGAFPGSSVLVFLVLPIIVPVQGRDLGYPFAAMVVSGIVGLGAAVLSLRVVPRLTGTK